MNVCQAISRIRALTYGRTAPLSNERRTRDFVTARRENDAYRAAPIASSGWNRLQLGFVDRSRLGYHCNLLYSGGGASLMFYRHIRLIRKLEQADLARIRSEYLLSKLVTHF